MLEYEKTPLYCPIEKDLLKRRPASMYETMIQRSRLMLRLMPMRLKAIAQTLDTIHGLDASGGLTIRYIDKNESEHSICSQSYARWGNNSSGSVPCWLDRSSQNTTCELLASAWRFTKLNLCDSEVWTQIRSDTLR